jgi:hypothetical protein
MTGKTAGTIEATAGRTAATAGSTSAVGLGVADAFQVRRCEGPFGSPAMWSPYIADLSEHGRAGRRRHRSRRQERPEPADELPG